MCACVCVCVCVCEQQVLRNKNVSISRAIYTPLFEAKIVYTKCSYWYKLHLYWCQFGSSISVNLLCAVDQSESCIHHLGQPIKAIKRAINDAQFLHLLSRNLETVPPLVDACITHILKHFQGTCHHTCITFFHTFGTEKLTENFWGLF